MEEVKSRAKWWNNEVVVPSLRTSLCMLSGPGALPHLRNLTICNHQGFQEDKNIHSYAR